MQAGGAVTTRSTTNPMLVIRALDYDDSASDAVGARAPAISTVLSYVYAYLE